MAPSFLSRKGLLPAIWTCSLGRHFEVEGPGKVEIGTMGGASLDILVEFPDACYLGLLTGHCDVEGHRGVWN